jgi:hypothetical protein
MFLTVGFIGKWTWGIACFATARASDVFILCGMGCGWRAAEGEDASWLEWKS